MTSRSAEFSSDGEDDEDSSSSPFQMSNQFQSALEEFRENWQNEIRSTSHNDNKSTAAQNHLSMPVRKLVNASDPEQSLIDESDDEKAERLFKVGIELEQSGKVYDALQYYRRAVQLVPDIEFRIYEISKRHVSKNLNNDDSNLNKHSLSNVPEIDPNKNQEDAENLEGVDLVQRFQIQLGSKLIKSSVNEKTLTTALHISDLPLEIIFYILKWTISNQLDMYSLEQIAATCKGLYLCARDEEIWKQACIKVWGVNTCTLQESHFHSWREMFISRERIHFNGCYISKTSYLRYGENSFQDEFYRPIQLIMYYRYVRFLPDGTVFLMTNSDEPQIGVNKLRNIQNIRPDVLRGRWRLHGNVVIIMCVKMNQVQMKSGISRRRGSIINMETSPVSTTYYMEMIISGTSKKKFCQLQWNKYSLVLKRANGSESRTEFELTNSKFPSLWFSKVKSYHLEADAPL